MTINTDTTITDLLIPAGVARTDEWKDDTPLPYRILFGELPQHRRGQIHDGPSQCCAVRRWAH